MKLRVYQGNLNSAIADEKAFRICIRQISDPHQRTQFKGILHSSFIFTFIQQGECRISKSTWAEELMYTEQVALLRLPSINSHQVRCQRAKGYQSLSKDFPSPVNSQDTTLSTNFDNMQVFFCRQKAETSLKIPWCRYCIQIKAARQWLTSEGSLQCRYQSPEEKKKSHPYDKKG